MVLADNLLLKLNAYLAGRLTLGDLEVWLAPRLPELMREPHSLGGKLAGAIELSLAEIADGIAGEDEVKVALSDYLQAQEASARTF